MKKLLAVFLALAVLMSMTGIAFAGIEGRYCDFHKLKSGTKVNGGAINRIYYRNDSQALTGDANAVGSASQTIVAVASEAKALDDGNGSGADNSSTNIVANKGTADSHSGPADAPNTPYNTVDSAINLFAEATSDCDVIDAGLCGCCPATVKGDIVAAVSFDNSAYALTGDANAVGNASLTAVVSDDKASATNGGLAANTCETAVSNNGTAVAESGKAIVINQPKNYVKIDIFRGAASSKNVSSMAAY